MHQSWSVTQHVWLAEMVQQTGSLVCQSSAGGKTWAEVTVWERFAIGADHAVHVVAEAVAGHPGVTDLYFGPAVMWHLAERHQDAEATVKQSY